MRLAARLTPALAVAAAIGLGGLVRAPAHAVAAPSCAFNDLHGGALTLTATTVTPADGPQFVVCDGKVRSFDGTPLHVNITLPTIQTSTCVSPLTSCPPPLLMFLSGWSNDICQFESTSVAGYVIIDGKEQPTPYNGCADFIGHAGYKWNNAWAASQGFVSLNYTPRGWYESCGKNAQTGYTYATDTTCSDTTGEESWVHLYDRRYEIRDAQYMAALLANAGVVDPSRIVTTGDSGGGGPSWDLALSRDQVAALDSTPSAVHTCPWTTVSVTTCNTTQTTASGTPLHLIAALPMYTWTDLVDSLMPNGRSALGGFTGAPPDGSHVSPVGVEKASYVSGLFAKGLSNVPGQPQDSAQYSAPGNDPSADLQTWFAEINAGEPTFGANPDSANVIAQIGGPLRSAFAMPVPADNSQQGALNTEKPTYVIQGITDPLFPANQAFTMINRLKDPAQGGDPNYPVYGFFGDIGHSYADNPLDVWQQAHNTGDAWLLSVLSGNIHPSTVPITVDTTRCVSGQTLQTFTGASLDA
ncbi:MAG: hypothetical protein ABR498_07240, partial [Candidatus Dormibacteria bacterium]